MLSFLALPSSLKRIATSTATLSACVLSLVCITVVTLAAYPSLPQDDSVSLPVLVYPEDGLSTHIESIQVQANDVSAVDSLYFRMHQPYYHVGGNQAIDEVDGFDVEGAASIRVNGGSWVDVRDENINCAWWEDRWPGGCVGGTVSTIRFTIPAAASGNLVAGQNTIDFRFNGTDGIRSGFRVLGVGFMTPTDPSVTDFDAYPGDYNGDGIADGAINGTTWELSDPSTWSAPAQGDAANGEALWMQRDLLLDGDGTELKASCGDCHFDSGADLQYFAFSNRSIIARSRFHGLSQQQGEDIAAYIRSISLQMEDGTSYDPPGTPWDPPFQPGPEMLGSDQHPDKGDQVYWMAGAGLRWVLDGEREVPNTERDILAHIFPENGDPSQGVDYLESGPYAGDLNWHWVHQDSVLNTRAIPQAQQFPDWNNWLPDLHPLDFEPNFQSTEFWNFRYGEHADLMDTGNVEDISDATGTLRWMFRNQLGWSNGIDKQSMIGNPTTNEVGLARLSAKMEPVIIALENYFEHYHFDNLGQQNCGYDGDQLQDWFSWCEELTWPDDTWTLFATGPHVAATLEEPPYGYGDEPRSSRMSHVWYEVQIVVNPGGYDPGGNNPVDWSYQQTFFPGDELPLSQFISTMLNVQLLSNGLGNNPGGRTGLTRSWAIGGIKPHLIFGVVDGAKWGNLPKETSSKVLEAWWRSWWEETKSYDVSSFPRDDYNDVLKYDNENYGPEPEGYVPPPEYRTHYYTGWGSWYEDDPDEAAGLLDSLTTWGAQMWPLGNDPNVMNQYNAPTWDNLVDYTPPSTGSQTIGLAQGWNLISSRINPSEPAVESVFGGIDSDLSLVKNEAGDIYSPAVGLNNIGDWQSREGYLVYMTNSQSMSVSGYGVDPTTSFMLEEGWNLIPYYPETTMTPADAFASISAELVLVKNQSGETYVPDPQDPIDDIGQLQPGQAYKVYVSSPVSFSYPSSN
jgi:hypothetical protein